MPRPDRLASIASPAVARPRAAGAAFAALACSVALAADPPLTQPLRFEAPIAVSRAATFVQLPLPAAVYARSEQRLADLRVVDARDERVPFALLPPRSAVEIRETVREAVLYPLPPAARGQSIGATPALPVDVVVEGDRISVHRRALPPSAAPAGTPVPGWLFDTGERRADQLPPRRLQLRWPAADAEFSAGFRVDSSDDLRSWRDAGVGQLIALRSQVGPLAQPLLELPAGAGRFVRLIWFDPQSAPMLAGAGAIVSGERSVDLDAATVLSADATTDRDDPRALVFDLGAILPIDDVALRFAAGTRVTPARVQVRARVAEPWREVGATVFSRFESREGAAAGDSPPFAVGVQARFVRLVVDERASIVKPADAKLVAQFRADTLVFASEGTAPYRLLAGSLDAPPGVLPAATLLPRLDDERPRFGSATLGAFGEIAAARQIAEGRERSARLRPIALWAVLLVGVVLLSLMVWRLMRSPRPLGSPPADSPPAGRPPPA